MVHPGIEHRIEGRGEIFVALSRGAVDQIEVHMSEPGGPRLTRGGDGPTGGVRAVQHCENMTRRRLHPQ